MRCFVIKQILLIAVVFFFSGCASLPETVPVPELERDAVVSTFLRMIHTQKVCPGRIDAETTVTLRSFALSGTMAGFFQAIAPSYIKFVGLNVLGQPTLILVSDGKHFQFVNAGEATAYQGLVDADAFTEYAPEGFDTDFGFYWFAGKLFPGPITIQSVEKDVVNGFYRVWFQRENDSRHYSVLIDAGKALLMNATLFNENGSLLLAAEYGTYSSGPCPLPGTMKIKTGNRRGTMEFVFSWTGNAASLAEKDFTIRIPSGFKRIDVK